MEHHLAKRAFFAAAALTLADVALYAYTHVAREGGFALAHYPAVGRWLAAVAAVPGHAPLDA